MDESWRMRMGVPNGRNHRRRNSETGLEPEDFDDVFGGPPRSVLARKLSADFTQSEWFYQEIFRQPEIGDQEIVGGRRLPEFVIPERRFSNQKVKSMSKSKSSCSSVLSFEEELRPYRPPATGVGEEDEGLSSFTSRLRPVTVPGRWSSTSTLIMPKSKCKKQELPAFGCNNTTYMDNNHFDGSECDDYEIKNFKFGIRQSNSPFETMGHPMPNLNLQHNSPPSTMPYTHQQCKGNNTTNFLFEDNMSIQQGTCKVDVEDEATNSYIVELNSNTSMANNLGAIDVDEAIAWAKERYQGWSSDNGGTSLRDKESNTLIEMSREY